MEIVDNWVSDPLEYRYLYNGKELNGDFGLDWYDYGARWYDPSIGRFTGVDPLADQRSRVSPYNYVQNNPLNRIDPTGALDQDYDWEPKVDAEGNISYISEDGDSYHTFVEQYGQEAADDVFSNNCDGCFDKNVTYGEGDISLSSQDAYPLIINNIEVSFIGSLLGESSRTTTDVQKIYNQLAFAADYESAKGNSSFDINNYFIDNKGNPGPSKSAQGKLSTSEGTYRNSVIEYTSIMSGYNLLNNTPTERLQHNGFRHEYSPANRDVSRPFIPLKVYFLNK